MVRGGGELLNDDRLISAGRLVQVHPTAHIRVPHLRERAWNVRMNTRTPGMASRFSPCSQACPSFILSFQPHPEFQCCSASAKKGRLPTPRGLGRGT